MPTSLQQYESEWLFNCQPTPANQPQAIAPPAHTAVASTSTLCKLLTWHLAGTWQSAAAAGAAPALLHQADWLASLLHGRRGVSDWNNALKLGFDPALEGYPEWLLRQVGGQGRLLELCMQAGLHIDLTIQSLEAWSDDHLQTINTIAARPQEYASLLPSTVVAPGAPVAPLTPAAAARAGLPAGAVVCGGTTDSIAAFVAAGVTEVGQAVTSLGSTMAVKLLSDQRVDDAVYGVYSHRLGES